MDRQIEYFFRVQNDIKNVKEFGEEDSTLKYASLVSKNLYHLKETGFEVNVMHLHEGDCPMFVGVKP